jgi:glycosyltransferase involved in cell wall biosynthesis
MEDFSSGPAAGPTWILIPMFNETSTIGVVISDLRRHFDQFLCVDDGSTDDSAQVAEQAGATVLRHPINLGQGAALQTGFEYLKRYTAADYVITFDADGQHLADDAALLLRRAQQDGLDVVLASRSLGGVQDIPTSRRALLLLAVWLSRRTSGLPLTDTHNGLRVLSRRAFSKIRLRQPRMAYASELEGAIVRHDLSFSEHPATVVYTDYSRAKGQRNLNAINILFDLALQTLVRAS